MLEVKKYTVNMLETNCYLIKDVASGLYAIVDPGGMTPPLLQQLAKCKQDLRYILLTHGHFDHMCNAPDIQKMTGAPIVLCEDEAALLRDPALNLSSMFTQYSVKPFKADILLGENASVTLGQTKICMLKTPGHTSGSACFLADGRIFSGDTLMCGTVGRTDLPTGNIKKLQESLKKLKALKGNYMIHPGHGKDTTLAFEIENNHYLRNMRYEDLY